MNNILLATAGDPALEIIKYESPTKSLFINKNELSTDSQKVVTSFVSLLNSNLSTTLNNFNEESFNLIITVSKDINDTENEIDYEALTTAKKTTVQNFFNLIENYNKN